MADMLNNTNNELVDSSALELTGKITVAVIILLFMAVVIFLFLHLYAKEFWWRVNDQHNPSLNPVSATVQQDPISLALRKGLDPAVIKSLPVLVFSSEEFKEGFECSVCLSELVDGEKARLLPKCNHGFHVDCIDMWFKSHSTCPLCRKPVCVSPKTSSRHESVEFSSTTFLPASENYSGSSNIPVPSECPSSSQSEGGPSHSVIDIPMETVAEIFAAEDRNGDGEETKTQQLVLTRMQTFKRLLSWESRANACSPRAVACSPRAVACSPSTVV